MKTLKLREIINQGRYEIAAHMIVIGLVKVSQEQDPPKRSHKKEIPIGSAQEKPERG